VRESEGARRVTKRLDNGKADHNDAFNQRWHEEVREELSLTLLSRGGHRARQSVGELSRQC